MSASMASASATGSLPTLPTSFCGSNGELVLVVSLTLIFVALQSSVSSWARTRRHCRTKASPKKEPRFQTEAVDGTNISDKCSNNDSVPAVLQEAESQPTETQGWMELRQQFGSLFRDLAEKSDEDGFGFEFEESLDAEAVVDTVRHTSAASRQGNVSRGETDAGAWVILESYAAMGACGGSWADNIAEGPIQ
eukprot:TRINITY_DN5096_c0_g1_i2.p2 TRINITY_DN5096_c0_g1~~TRINITY_DN5096_c0_g1_i2.p2  ORF type:complete len:193 (-),score=36.79 TRINITY_DN5096_c0_g1_i2:122-700(-)